jgi:hypothetical protein
MLPKFLFKMAAIFKMATKTKFAYVAKAKRISFTLRLLPNSIMHFYRFWAEKKKKKKIGSSKIKNGRSIQDGR